MKNISFFIVVFLLLTSAMQAQNWETLNATSQKLSEENKFQEAMLSFEKARTQAKKEFGKKHKNYVLSCKNLAALYNMQGSYSKAEALYTEAQNITEKLVGKNHPDYADTCHDLGDLYDEKGAYKQSETFYMEAKDIRENLLGKDNEKYATSCNDLALLYKKQGLYAKAELLFLESKSILEKTLGKNDVNYALSCNNLAILYEKQGLYPKAETLYLESKNVAEKAAGKENNNYALSCNNLAGLYKKQGLYAKSEPLLMEAKNIRERIFGKEHRIYASSCHNLAGLYEAQGLHEKAEALCIEAKNIREKTVGKQHPTYAASCNILGLLYQKQGFYAKAIPLYLEAKESREKIFGKQHPNYASSCHNLGSLYEQQGEYAKAVPLYVEAKNIREKVFGNKHPDYATSCNDLAVLYEKQGFYNQALPLYVEAKAIREKTIGKDHPDYALSCNELGYLYEKQGDFFKASAHFQQASETLIFQTENNFSNLSENEKELFLKTFSENFERYNSFAVKAYKKIPSLTDWTYNNAIATKSFLFSGTQKIKKRILSANNEDLDDLYESWKSKKTEFAQSLQLSEKERKKERKYLEILQTEITNLEKTLSQKSEFFAEKNDKKRYQWRNIQRNLKKDEAIVEIIRTKYFDKTWTDSTLYIAVIITQKTQNHPEMVVLGNGNEIETDMVAFYKNCIRFKIRDKFSYDALWGSIKNKLGDTKKVYFVPDGLYHQINLLTLQNPTSKKFVRSEISVQLLSSSKDLVRNNENSRKQRKNIKDYQVHLFGYPAYAPTNIQKEEKNKLNTKENNTHSFMKMGKKPLFFDPNSGVISPLVGTQKEVNNIYKIFQQKKVNAIVYVANDANEKTIKALKNADIVHIATHGFFLEDTEGFNKENADKFRENPLLRSGLLLKDAEKGLRGEILEGEDGVLTAQEALNLNLDDTELVVMSACETGLGEIKNGEGVYGLQRSFQQAGAKTILMSLWKVDDNATQELMTAFYTNLSLGKTKRQAFDDAQETLYKKYKNPYFWGAFVMVGE